MSWNDFSYEKGALERKTLEFRGEDAERIQFVMGKQDDQGSLLHMGSTGFMFMKRPLRTIIFGDLVPRRNGVVSNLGYGLNWFVSELSPSYLAGKFLDNNFWDANVAKEEFLFFMGLAKKEDPEAWLGYTDTIRKIGPIQFENEYLFHESMFSLFRGYDHSFGYGYKPQEYRWLAAIQQRFRELYFSPDRPVIEQIRLSGLVFLVRATRKVLFSDLMKFGQYGKVNYIADYSLYLSLHKDVSVEQFLGYVDYLNESYGEENANVSV